MSPEQSRDTSSATNLRDQIGATAADIADYITTQAQNGVTPYMDIVTDSINIM